MRLCVLYGGCEVAQPSSAADTHAPRCRAARTTSEAHPWYVRTLARLQCRSASNAQCVGPSEHECVVCAKRGCHTLSIG